MSSSYRWSLVGPTGGEWGWESWPSLAAVSRRAESCPGANLVGLRVSYWTPVSVTGFLHAMRGGRPSKGQRKLLSIKVPDPLHAEIVDAAGAAGLTINDYAAGLLTAMHRSGRLLLAEPPAVWTGPRQLVGARVPVGLAQEIVAAAQAAGLTLRDYGAVLLALAHGRPPMIASPQNEQEELPLAMAAG